MNPEYGPGPSCSKTGQLNSLDNSLSSPANLFHLTLLARFLPRPVIHILIPSFSITFLCLYRVFASYFIYWIAAYPVDNAIYPLNNEHLLHDSRISVDRAPARCLGGHGFESCRGLKIFSLSHARDMLIIITSFRNAQAKLS